MILHHCNWWSNIVCHPILWQLCAWLMPSPQFILEAFVRLYDKHFPRRKGELKYNNRKPWLTSALKESIRRKNNLYYQYRKIKSRYYEFQYKSYRNKLTKNYWNVLKRNIMRNYWSQINLILKRLGAYLKVLWTRKTHKRLSLNSNYRIIPL